MIHYISTHWALISGITVIVISEAMPFLPTKYSGIIQAVLGGLQKVPLNLPPETSKPMPVPAATGPAPAP